MSSSDHSPLDCLLPGDCLEILPTLPEKSVDLIFADPPYNLQLNQELWRPNMTKVDAVDDEWDKFSSFASYDDFTRQWLSACRRLLKDDGTLWVIGSYHNIYRVGAILMDLGFWILNDVLWIKTNPMPNFRGVRFTNAHETLLWAKKSEKARYTFNYHQMKQINGGKQMRSDWKIPICSGAERIRLNGEKAHSTQKPEALLERVILSSSRPGALVLDPFFGSGTTGAVAKRLGRHWIGIERDPAYVRVAQARLERVQPQVVSESPVTRRSLPRIGFSQIMSAGLLHFGTPLYFRADPLLAAIIQPDGRLCYQGHEGSIHQIGRFIEGGPCNGWEHWYYHDREQDTLLPIDALRQRLRLSQSSVPAIESADRPDQAG